MLKILQIGMSNNKGGIESFIRNYCYNLNKKNNIIIDFLNMTKEGLREDITKIGNEIKVYNEFKHPIKCYFELKEILEKNKYDIIHINKNSVSSIIILLAAKKANIKVRILHSHNTMSTGNLLVNCLHFINKRIASKLCNYYFACSEEAAKWMFPKKIIKQKEYVIFNNAIDVNKFKYNEEIRKNKRKELNIEDDVFVVGHIGRFMTQKNHTFLIDIFKQLQLLIPNSLLLLVGQGKLMDDIRRKVKELGLEDKVRFLGARNDVNEIYQVFDTFVFPSLYEGLGMALIEAQCSGLPCIVSSKVPEVAKITDNVKFLPLNQDAIFWANEIHKVSKGIKRRNVENIISNQGYCIDKEIQKLIDVYNKYSKIKVCHFVNGINNGGVEKVILNYTSNIERSKYEFHIVTQGESDQICLEEFKKLGFIVHNVTKKKESVLKNGLDIIRILKKEKFDIVHCHMTSTNLFPLFYALLCRVKVRINHSHLTVEHCSFKKKIIIKLGMIFDTAKFACSKDAALTTFGKKAKWTLINNAINVEKYRYDKVKREEIRKQLNIAGDEIIIGHIGRFVKQKNHKFIIEMFYKIHQKNKKYKLILIGIGEEQEKIVDKVNELNLENNVIFLNSIDNVNEIMQAFDIFILPSLYEGLGIVLIEAQISGLKCLASSNNPKEVKVTNNIELLDLDVDIWKEKIMNIKKYDRESQQEKIKKNGFDIKTEAKKLDNLYNKLYYKE